MRSLIGSVCALKKPGDRKNMNSVFKGFFSVPMCISRPNRAKWLDRRVIPLLMSVLDSKTKDPSSTYSMQNISKRVKYEKLMGRWITNCPVDLGEVVFAYRLGFD